MKNEFKIKKKMKISFSINTTCKINFYYNIYIVIKNIILYTGDSSVGRAMDCRGYPGYPLVAGSIPAGEIAFFFSTPHSFATSGLVTWEIQGAARFQASKPMPPTTARYPVQPPPSTASIYHLSSPSS